MTDLVTAVLANPASLKTLDAPGWDELVRQARQADLLARIAALASDPSIALTPPAGVQGHLDAERVLMDAQRIGIRREVSYIERALAPLDIPVILLKGAAYLLADLPAASGRHFSDIDILIPREALPATESALMLAGWMGTHNNEYDQHYYRIWMHELPPMQHMHRQTVLDVHHAILPLTARLRPDSRYLLANSVPIQGSATLRTLCPVDMVLHSMTHLFCNEEFSHGLRDLSDLDLLLRHFGQQPEFWAELPVRAVLLQLGRPLFYGLHYTRNRLGTPVPDDVFAAIKRQHAPPASLLGIIDALWARALTTPHPGCDDAWSPLARSALFLRAHWMRMPPRLLLRHLVHKLVTPKPRKKSQPEDPDR